MVEIGQAWNENAGGGGYKIAKAYLFQCYSGYSQNNYNLGGDSATAMKLRGIGFAVTATISSQQTSARITYTYTVDIDWTKAWENVAINPLLYEGQDWIIDTKK